METNERGQVLPLMALAVLIAGGATVGLARIGEAAIMRARAQTAADAAALAGAVDGRTSASRLAADNGG
ncbi:MAG TPA: pilus assembly protein TadG-related protein, partial [Acidimicrobiales bacterium]|nr:pilus assembly protein TadG-related protein [Acidimicrobiales bacterium]